MHILRIEHRIRDFDSWKAAFEGDPVSWQQSGVHRHRILRPIDDTNYVMIDLEFDNSSEAEAVQEALRELWSRVEGMIVTNPRARIVEVVESKAY